MAEDEFDFSDIDFTPFIRPNYFEKGMDELKAEVGENNRFAAFELGRRFRAKNELNTAYQYFSLSAELGDTDAPLEAGGSAHIQVHEPKRVYAGMERISCRGR